MTPSQVVRLLRDSGATVATAESLTGGLVCATLVEVPGASDVLTGGVVAYATRLKSDLLGVDPEHLAERGTVDAGTAEQMARGARERLGATYGVSTTGVAGPDASEGRPPGTVYVGIASPVGARVEALRLSGDRAGIRHATVDAALSLLGDTVERGEGINPARAGL